MPSIDPDLLELATPQELAAYEKELRRQEALLSPLDYISYTSDGRFKRYPHTEILSRYSKAVCEHALYDSGPGIPAVWTPDPEDPEDGRWLNPETGEEAHNILTISMPPQHGKSSTVTETLPAWYLTANPHNSVIVTGYEAEFAKDFGRENRNKIEANPELGIEVDPKTRASDNWRIKDHDGRLITAGSGGPITGKRGDLIVIDDPVKNSTDALSQTERRKNKQWWESTVKSRVRTNTIIILIQTRWHEDDLAGHVQNTERCFALNLPALAFEETDDEGYSVDPDTGERDLLNRRPGEALCPALQTRSMLLKKKETGDSGDSNDGQGGVLWFAALYQGKPNIEGGGVLSKPYRYFTTETNFSGRRFYKTKDSHKKSREFYCNECIYFITADLAVSTKTHADYTVFTLFAWSPYNQLLVVDMLRERMESTEHMRKAEAFWQRARQATDGAGIRFFGVEDQTFGLSLIQHLRKEARIPVKSLTADKDKIARAIPVGMLNREDRLFLPADAEFLPDLEHEMQQFPNGRHDDMVDTLSYGVQESNLLPRQNKDEDLSLPEQLRQKRRKRGRKIHPVAGRL